MAEIERFGVLGVVAFTAACDLSKPTGTASGLTRTFQGRTVATETLELLRMYQVGQRSMRAAPAKGSVVWLPRG